MNKLVIFITLFTLALGASSSRAELIIYKGTEKEINTGANNGAPINWKLFVIVDPAAGSYARIRYASISGTKTHRILVATNTHIVLVVGADAKTYTAITHIPTDCQAQESPGVEVVSFKGLNAQLKVSAGSTIVFPKILTDVGVGLIHSSSGVPILDDVRRTLTFSPAQTLASNTAGETLNAALARLVNEVTSMGY
jgi:hypothetical protein